MLFTNSFKGLVLTTGMLCMTAVVLYPDAALAETGASGKSIGMRGRQVVIDRNIGRNPQPATPPVTTEPVAREASCGFTKSGSYKTHQKIIESAETVVCVPGVSAKQRYYVATIGQLCTDGTLGPEVELNKTYLDWMGKCERITGGDCGSHENGSTWDVVESDSMACAAPLSGNKKCSVTKTFKCNSGKIDLVDSQRVCDSKACVTPELESCGDHKSGDTWRSVAADPAPPACSAPLTGNKTCSITTINKCMDGVVSVVSSDTACNNSSCVAPLACGDHQSGTTWETVTADAAPPACDLPLLGNKTCSVTSVNKCENGVTSVVSSETSCNQSSCHEPRACGEHGNGASWETVAVDPAPPACDSPLVGTKTCNIRTVNQCSDGSIDVVSTSQECSIASCTKPDVPMVSSDAFLMLVKAGFQPTQAEINVAQSYANRRLAVAAMVDGMTKEYAINPPAASESDASTWWTKPTFPANWSSNDRFGTASNSMRAWYTSQLIASPSPLTERLILFWHNHFTTAALSKEDIWYGFKQHQAIRQNYDNYATLLTAMVRDPALLWYLDQQNSFATPEVKNSKGVVTTAAVYPSANFARELLELFTLGEGNYTEQDVTVASYALTGLSFNSTTGLFLYRPEKHYNFKTNWAQIPDPVTLLGQTVDTPDDVIKVLLTEPHHYAATRVVTKLWKEFVSSTPDAAIVDAIAVRFQDPQQYNYNIKPVLVDLFMTDDFWNARGTLVKSPVEFAVGIYRELGLPVSGNLTSIVGAFSSMGQEIFDSPSVQGYLGGINWINTYSLTRRQAYASSYGGVWGSEVLGASEKLTKITNYDAFISPRITTKLMLNPPTTQYISIIDAQKQVLADPAYSLK